MAIEGIHDPVDFAKELALECELLGIDGNTQNLQAALDIMNRQLILSGQDGLALIKATEAYEIPDDVMTVDLLLTDADIAQSRVDKPIVRGRLYGFNWLGSLPVSGFGALLHGVSYLTPVRHHTETLFVPLEAIRIRLS